MIRVVFSRGVGPPVTKGPYESIRIEGETMRAVCETEPFAVHENHHWRVAGEQYTRAECDCPVRLHLQRIDGKASKTYGPYESFSFVDGIAYVERKVFAFADRTIGDWYCHDDGRHYAIMVIEAAA